MAKKEIIRTTLLRADVRKEAMQEGMSEENYIKLLEKVNSEDGKFDYRIDVVDDWRASPFGYEKEFRMKRAVKGKSTILTGVPIGFIRHRAGMYNMSVDEFISKFEVVVMYDESREYMTYRFRKIFGV